MAITIKNPQQLDLMRESSRIVYETLNLLENEVKVGISTKALDKIAEDYITSSGAKPSFKGYRGYPASICASVNEEVIHGIPGVRKLKEGDIISIDVGAYKNGFHGDAARTFLVGNVSEEAANLVEVTKQSFFEALKYAYAGNHLYDISAAVQKHAEAFGYSVVKDFVGHGVGRSMHEDPQIPNYKQLSRGPKLCPGMTIAVEPMINMGTYKVEILSDNWTVVTRDHKLSAHYENTIHITDGEPELLTLPSFKENKNV